MELSHHGIPGSVDFSLRSPAAFMSLHGDAARVFLGVSASCRCELNFVFLHSFLLVR